MLRLNYVYNESLSFNGNRQERWIFWFWGKYKMGIVSIGGFGLEHCQ